MSNTRGRLFCVTTAGESHGPGNLAIVDGCPAGLELSEAGIQEDLDRRRPGQGSLTSARAEADSVEILSGVFEGKTTGSPIAMLIRNADTRSQDYQELKGLFRPSHADYSYAVKFGHRDWRGGGRASARETVARVAAGAVARALLAAQGVECLAWVQEVAGELAQVDPDSISRADIEANAIPCPDPKAAVSFAQRIKDARAQGDSLGGVVQALVRGVPAGWGEPVFGKLDGAIGAALLGIPAAKGVEIGSGFEGTRLRGSEHNDVFVRDSGGAVATRSNHSGGIQGGISTGMPITTRVAFKPVATIAQEQATLDTQGQPTTFRGRGRHDPCVLPRAVAVVEAELLLTLADAFLLHRARAQLLVPGWSPSE